MADGKSCRDRKTGKKTMNKVEGCAKACSGISTVFVYGKTNKRCYCINWARNEGECSDPYDNSDFDTYRYNGRLWYSPCVFVKILSTLGVIQ